MRNFQNLPAALLNFKFQLIIIIFSPSEKGSARVPLIISGPGFEPNSTETGLASLIDIYPTLLHAAKINSRTELDGLALQNVCFSENVFFFRYFFKKIDQMRPITSVCHAEHLNTSTFMIREGNTKALVFCNLYFIRFI